MLTANQLPPRYRLVALLGEGSMGTVSRVHDRLSGQDVALKQVLLEPDVPPDQAEQELLRLAHEFRVLAGLRHPHIISVLDYGFDAERRPFYTMELLPDVRDILTAGRGLPIVEQLALLLQALEALAYLHRRGVLHHDLKPANVLVAGGSARLLDFGLAVLANQPRGDDAFGTLQYLAPEVLDGQPYTEASDLYSLGVIAYELVLDRHPFDAATVRDFLDQVCTQAPDLSQLGAASPLRPVLQQLLAKHPADRPPSAQAAISALQAAFGAPERDTTSIRESYLQAATFVGRSGEQARLRAGLQRAIAGQGQLWLIAGESGVGKSRLLDELRAEALVAGMLVTTGQAISEGGLPYQLWRAPVRRLVLETPLSDLDASILQELVPDIALLLDRPIPPAPELPADAARARLHLTVVALLRSLQRPLLLLLEDLQWATESLALLAEVSNLAARQPLLIVGSYRSDDRPELPTDLPHAQVIRLDRLGADAVAHLSAAMLGSDAATAPIVQLLQRESEGNTYFLVEMVRALAEESGGLARIGLATPPDSLWSGGVQRVVQRRLDQAPHWTRQMLAFAAVAGRQIDIQMLERLAALPTMLPASATLDRWLSACADVGVLSVTDGVWQFSHDKLRDGLLAQAAPAAVRGQHSIVAEALEQLYGADDQYASQIAYHWRRAERREREAAFSFRGGAYARRQGRVAEAVQLLSRARDLAPVEARAGLSAVYLELGAAHEVLGAWAETEADYRAALAYAQQPQHVAQAQHALGRLCRRRGEHDAALGWLGQAEARFAELSDDGGLAEVLAEKGYVYARTGEYARAREQLEAGMDLARGVGDMAGVASAFSNLGYVAFSQSEFARAQELSTEALALRRALGDKRGVSSSLNNLGLGAYAMGDYATAYRLLEEGLALWREMDDQPGVATALSSLGTVAFVRGEYATARQLLDESLALRHTIGDRWGIAEAIVPLSVVALAQADDQLAYALGSEGLALKREMGDPQGTAEALAVLGCVAYRRGDYPTARARYAESLTLARSLSGKHQVAYTLIGMAELAAAIGAMDGALQLAASARQLVAGLGSPLPVFYRHRLDVALAACGALSDEGGGAVSAIGRVMSADAAAVYAEALFAAIIATELA